MAATKAKTKPTGLTEQEKLATIERFLSSREGEIRRGICLTGNRQAAKTFLQGEIDFSEYEQPIGETQIHECDYEGLRVIAPHGKLVKISWDEVIDEAIDADVGAKTWPIPWADENPKPASNGATKGRAGFEPASFDGKVL